MSMAVDQITMDIDEFMRPDGDHHESWTKHSIYRIPPHMKDENPGAYTPQMVSIGPYHYGAAHLAAMQAHKARSLRNFLARTNKSLDFYMDALAPLTDELLDSYQLLDEHWRTNRRKFLKLMVLDGAFLAELLPSISDDPTQTVINLDSIRNFSIDIMLDIVKMENQIPRTVLQILDIALETAKPIEKVNDEEEAQHDEEKVQLDKEKVSELHILDFLRAGQIKDCHLKSTDKYNSDPFTPVKSAWDLLEAGVKFRAIDDDTSSISFEHGTLNLPVFFFDSKTEPVFLNMIAFEESHYAAGKEVSSYFAFMQGLISSARDVSILKSHGVILKHRLRNEDISNIMNKISKNAIFDPESELCEVRDSVNEYYANKMKSKRHRMKILLPQWWQNLLQTHFKNPWTIISLLAATILLVLTLLQTVYTMKS